MLDLRAAYMSPARKAPSATDRPCAVAARAAPRARVAVARIKRPWEPRWANWRAVEAQDGRAGGCRR